MSYEEPTTSAKSSLKLPARPESDSIEGDNPDESDAAVIRSDPVISCAFHNLMRGRPVRVSAATFEFVIINCKIPKHNYALVQHQYHEQLKRFEKEWRFLLIGFGAKFERFPALPAEVQMMIWQDTVNEPRVVGL
ncbi:uncharacterized protein PAC_11521 [Phialocephala subalpina]|uniref:2EXR domain-containing protein n=1 Tax=Phialocephala subalpina TaxID=576137 RepID=A0A1L7X9C4_9HELO|nr:uncharacterized protein PAC_11521 [Phialocephala subalpina]